MKSLGEQLLDVVRVFNVRCSVCGRNDFTLTDLMSFEWGQRPEIAKLCCKRCGFHMEFHTDTLLSAVSRVSYEP